MPLWSPELLPGPCMTHDSQLTSYRPDMSRLIILPSRVDATDLETNFLCRAVALPIYFSLYIQNPENYFTNGLGFLLSAFSLPSLRLLSAFSLPSLRLLSAFSLPSLCLQIADALVLWLMPLSSELHI